MRRHCLLEGAAATWIFARFVPKIIFDKLAKAKGGAQVAGTWVIGGRGRGSRSQAWMVGMIAISIALINRPIKPMTKEILGPSLRIT